MIPPARIILPISTDSWDSSTLSGDWKISQKIWKRGEIATVPIGKGKWHCTASVEEKLTLFPCLMFASMASFKTAYSREILKP